MEAGYTVAIEPSGREHVVVAIKGTFSIPEQNGEVARLGDKQLPLVMADIYWGEPGLSAPRYEADFCLRKQQCDIVVNATACLPEGRPTTRVRTGVQIGSWQKVIDVVGDRVWLERAGHVQISQPEKFVEMPITYDNAFGGVDDLDTDPSKHDVYSLNPIGQGYAQLRSRSYIDGKKLPNTEAPNDPVSAPWNQHLPMSYGIQARFFPKRYQYAGNYDQDWLDSRAPLLPADFDERYYQAAPQDQQVAKLKGGEQVILDGLSTKGRIEFILPTIEVPVVYVRKRESNAHEQAQLDTILIEPDFKRFQLVWRTALPLRRDIFDVTHCLVGKHSRAWWRAQESGKIYFSSIRELIDSRSDVVE